MRLITHCAVSVAVTSAVTQARHEPIMLCAVARLSVNMHMHSRRVQISASLIQRYSSSGIMLPMLSWATLSSNHKATNRSGGHVISVQMDIDTAGQHLSSIEPTATGVLSAVATKCASTTPWLPRLPWLQLNGIMTQMLAPPDDVLAQSNHMANWHCSRCGCKWEATISTRVSKSKAGCPQCADVANIKKKTKHPTFTECSHPLLAEWDHKRNAAQGYYPDKIRLKSGKQISWFCTKCPAGQEHSWSAAPFSRTGRSQTGCPFCAGKAACRCNSLQALYPETAADWDYCKNQGVPSEYTASSTYTAW